MTLKQINRKEFIVKALNGLAGIGIISKVIGNQRSPALELRTVGKTGIMVSPVCFGAPRTNDESLIKYALDKGINFIDTGRAYGNGNNEKLVGRAIKGSRKDVIIQTKIRLEENELRSKLNGRKRSSEIKAVLTSRLEESLKALDTEYIDILLFHEATDEALLFHPATMDFFSGIKTSGVIKACGFSSHNDFMNLPERNNSELFYDVVMVPFNHNGSFIHSITGSHSEWNQERLISILTEAGSKGIGVIAMKTCSGESYSPTPEVKPDYSEAVTWVLKHKFISSASVAMSDFEQVDEQLLCLKRNF